MFLSVFVLRGLQSAHPPSPVELLRRGTHLPGGGSYVPVFPVCLFHSGGPRPVFLSVFVLRGLQSAPHQGYPHRAPVHVDNPERAPVPDFSPHRASDPVDFPKDFLGG